MRAVLATLLLAGCYFQSGQAAADAAKGSADAPADMMMPQPRLVDRGLVVRYFINEAASGQMPAALVDSALQPLALPITYTSKLAYTEDNGHRGLHQASMTPDNARADVGVAGTKVGPLLAGKTQWTIEAVYDVQAIPATINARIVTIATGITTYGTMALLTVDRAHVNLELNGVGTTWPVDETMGRVVVHAVVNTNATTASGREQVYVAGGPVINGGGTGPSQGAGLSLQATDHLTIGNVDTGGQSFQGTVYYVALYDVALSQSEVAQNAAALATDDDHP